MYDSLSRTFAGIQYVWLGISIFLLVLLLLSRTKIFRNALSQERYTKREYIIFTVIFTILGLCGTFWNFRTPGGIMTFRAVPIMLSGFIGGPIVGTITGLIVGINRIFILQTATAPINGGLSILQGIAAGLLSPQIKKHSSQRWMWALFYSIGIEIVYWLFYALLTWPYAYINTKDLLSLVVPIIVTNTPAVALFIGVLEATTRQQDSEKTETAKTAFNSANMLIQTIHDEAHGFDFSKTPRIITTALPHLIWSAIITNDNVFISTNYKNPRNQSQGDAETSILLLQKTLPSMPHLLQLRIEGKTKTICRIFASNPTDTPLSKTDKEFLNGTARIIELIHEHEELKKEKLLLQEAEIRALQAQINPHFLYNTLNTINFYVRSDPDTARNLLKYLSDYFRHTLNNPSKMILLSEEIYDITCYVELERARFSDRLQIEYRIPLEKMKKIQIPPLLLQPLVENAIIHGILKKPEGGKIIVGLHEHPHLYKIFVADTGVGIPQDKLGKLLTSHKRRDNIGLINVHQRLLSIFGEKSRLHIISRTGKGTVVYIIIPKEGEHDNTDNTAN